MSEFNFIEYDSEQIKNELLLDYKEMTGREVSPGSAEYDFVIWCAYRETIIRSLINYTGLQNLVNYADLPGLKEIGDMLRVPYIYATPARTTIKYTFSKSFDEVINIPLDHKVSVNGLYFLAKENLELPIGETEIDVTSECAQAGTVGNGYLPGEINTIVDPIEYLSTAINITESDGGTNDEDIEVYRIRIKQGPAGYSVAGPTEAYEYHTRAAYTSVKDVYITTIEGSGIVEIYPTVITGLPSTEELNRIQSYFDSTPGIKPLTDKVIIKTPIVKNYNIAVNYWILEGTNDLDSLKIQIESSVNTYIAWQDGVLGRDLSPDNLIYEMIRAGAKRVQVINPIFSSVSENEVPIIGNITINYQGVEK